MQAPNEALNKAFRASPVMFIENIGQWDENARFQVWGGPAGTMWLADDAIWLTVAEPKEQTPQPEDVARGLMGLTEREPEKPLRAVNLKLTFVGANPRARLEPFDRLDTVVNYYIGADESRWRANAPVWGGVRYVDLYPGMDLEITGQRASADESKPESLAHRVFTWRLVCKTVCDKDVLANVRLRIEGAVSVQPMTPDGAKSPDRLRIRTEAGEVMVPLVYVKGSDALLPTPMRVEVAQDGTDVLRPMTEHKAPAIANVAGIEGLAWSTFLGGGSGDDGWGIAVDGSGAAYVTGGTESFNFPTTPGAFDRSHDGD